jgi:hypothetical protein
VALTARSAARPPRPVRRRGPPPHKRGGGAKGTGPTSGSADNILSPPIRTGNVGNVACTDINPSRLGGQEPRSDSHVTRREWRTVSEKHRWRVGDTRLRDGPQANTAATVPARRLAPQEYCELMSALHPFEDDDWDRQMKGDDVAGRTRPLSDIIEAIKG